MPFRRWSAQERYVYGTFFNFFRVRTAFIYSAAVFGRLGFNEAIFAMIELETVYEIHLAAFGAGLILGLIWALVFQKFL